MSTWSITGSGTFAALGLANLRRTRTSQAADIVTFTAPTSFIGAALLSYGSTVTITKDGTTWFKGRVNNIPRQGDPRRERITYELVGPWWYLEHCIYQQSWQLWSGSSVTAVNKSRVILGQDTSGNRITTGAQIGAAIDYAIGLSAPITKGTIDPDLYIPWEEATDITCAEAIIRQLRWSPDTVCWFDYSTSNPTFHCRKRANLSAITVDAVAGSPVQKIEVTPRYDLQIPGVLLRFEQLHDNDGQVYHTVTEQTAGTTNAFNTLVSTIELAGSTVRHLSQAITVAAYPADLNADSFWKSIMPQLAGVADADLTVTNASRSPGTYSNYLVTGTIQPWMTTVNAEEDTITADLEVHDKDEDSYNVQKHRKRKLTCRLIATDATTRTYRKLASLISAEPVPTGLATALYNAWSVLQYDGMVVTKASECPGTHLPGTKLNITNGVAAWASMDALIQRTVEDIDLGITTVLFGPARHLGPAELVTLLRTFRMRRVAYHHNSRDTGEAEDDDSVTNLGGLTPKVETGEHGGEPTLLVAQNRSGATVNARWSIDPSALASATDEKVLVVKTDTGVKVVQFDWVRLT